MDHSTRDILPVEVGVACNIRHLISAFFKDASELDDWRLPLSYMKGRHLEDIIGLPPMKENWRIKERVRSYMCMYVFLINARHA